MDAGHDLLTQVLHISPSPESVAGKGVGSGNSFFDDMSKQKEKSLASNILRMNP